MTCTDSVWVLVIRKGTAPFLEWGGGRFDPSEVGVGCPASSTFPWAAGWAVFAVATVKRWPGQMISAVAAEIRGVSIKASWLSWPQVSLFPPDLDSSKECLGQEPAIMLFRSCWPTSLKPREKPPSVCRLKILESSDLCSPKHGIVFKILLLPF